MENENSNSPVFEDESILEEEKGRTLGSVVYNEPVFNESPTPSRTPINLPGNEISTNKDSDSLWSTIMSTLKNPEKQKARASNVMALAEKHNLPFNLADGHFDELKRFTFDAQAPTIREYAGALTVAGAPALFAYNPISFLWGTAKFMGALEASSYVAHKMTGKDYTPMAGMSGALPEDTEQITRDVVDGLQMLGTAIATHQIGKQAPKFATRLTKNIIVENKMPESVFIEADKIRSIFQTGEFISEAELELFKLAGLEGPQVRQAVKLGLNVEFPAEKITTITDKPYWAKLKEIIKVSPYQERVIVEGGGKPTFSFGDGKPSTSSAGRGTNVPPSEPLPISGAATPDIQTPATPTVSASGLPVQGEVKGGEIATSSPLPLPDIDSYNIPTIRLSDGSMVTGEKGMPHATMWDKVEAKAGTDVVVKDGDRGWSDKDGNFLSNDERTTLSRQQTEETLKEWRKQQELEYETLKMEKERYVDIDTFDPESPNITLEELRDARSQLSERMRSAGAAGKDFTKMQKLSPEDRKAKGLDIQEARTRANEGKKQEALDALKFKSVKARIREITGQVKVGESLIVESKALNASLARAEREMALAEREWKAALSNAVSTTNRTVREAEVAMKRATLEKERARVKNIKDIISNRVSAEKEVRNLIKGIKKAVSGPMDVDYRESLQSLLSDYDLYVRTDKTLKKHESIRAFIEDQRAKGEIVSVPDKVVDRVDRKPVADMTLDELRELSETVHSIAKLGKLKSKLVAGKEARDFGKAVAETVEHVMLKVKDESTTSPSSSLISERRGKTQRLLDNKTGIISSGIKIESMVDMADGWVKNGPVYRNMFKPIVDGEIAKFEMENRISNRVKEIFNLLEHDWPSIISKKYEVDGIVLTKENAISIALNSGNEGNLRNLVEGNKITREQIASIMATLLPNEVQFVNEVWELVDSMFQDLARVDRKLTGNKTQRVEGHYFPIITDRELASSARAGRNADKDLFEEVRMRAKVKDGMVQSRTGGVSGPLSLLLDPIFSHLRDAVHYISFALPVRDVQKFIFNDAMRGALESRLGISSFNQFEPWLKDISNPQFPVTAGDRLFSTLRTNAAIQTMGWSLSVSLIQPLAYTQTINRLGLKVAMEGFASFYSDPLTNLEKIYALDPYMRERMQTMDRDTRDMLMTKDLADMFKNHDIRDSYFWLMSKTDGLVTAPTWWSEYIAQMKEHGNEELAIDMARKAVRQTQSSGMGKDLASIQRGGALQKLFVMFYTYFSSTANELWKDFMMYQDGDKTFGNLVRSWWWVLILPGAVAGVYSSLVREGEVKPSNVAKQMVGYAAGTMPVVGSVVNSWMENWEYKPTSVASLPIEIGKAIWEKEKAPHIIGAAGYATGLPTRQVLLTYDFISQLMKGNFEPGRLIYKPKKKNKGKSFKY